MAKMRTMTHHGRGKGKGGKAFGDRHDDRNFDTAQAKNINPDLTPENQIWHYYMDPPEPEKDVAEKDANVEVFYAPLNWRIQGMLDEMQGTDFAARDKARYYAEKRAKNQPAPKPTVAISENMTFEEVETRFYEDNFYRQLQQINDRYRASGHSERCKDMATWKQSRRNAPAESVYQIGDKHNTGVYVDAETLQACYDEFAREEQRWNEEHGKPFTILNRALHVDEPECPPHIHVRRAWHYKAADGTLRLGQEKALAQAGIELPDPDKKEGRFNNRKMVYDAMMREKWLDVLERHGVQVEREPVPGSKGKPSKDKEQYIREKYEALLQEAAAAKDDAGRQRQRAAEEAARAAREKAAADEAAALAAENTEKAARVQQQLDAMIQEQAAAAERVRKAEGRVSDLESAYRQQQKLYDELFQINDANLQIIDRNEAEIQEQHEILGLIQSYEQYQDEARELGEHMDLAEETTKQLSGAHQLFKQNKADAWLNVMSGLLSRLRSFIDNCIKRLQIYETSHHVPDDEKLSEPARKRADALDDKISDALTRAGLNASEGRQERQQDELSN